ncbi:hypothetical protein C9J03_02955 [Photobacterium gaetbulicola]|nr:hypothetical protein C9J03_02955 [Photobacterium gaetbulicola]
MNGNSSSLLSMRHGASNHPLRVICRKRENPVNSRARENKADEGGSEIAADGVAGAVKEASVGIGALEGPNSVREKSAGTVAKGGLNEVSVEGKGVGSRGGVKVVSRDGVGMEAK